MERGTRTPFAGREWQEQFVVSLDGKPVGTLIRDFAYGRYPEKPKWRGSLRDLTWKIMFDREAERRGLGHDFGPCATMRECVKRFGMGADGVLDHLKKKAASGGGGASSMETRKRKGKVGDGRPVTLQEQLVGTVKALAGRARSQDPENDLAFAVPIHQVRNMLSGVPPKTLDEALLAAEKAGLLRLHEESMHMVKGIANLHAPGRRPIQFASVVEVVKRLRRRRT